MIREIKIEVCAGSYSEAIEAAAAGADRIEWCAAFDLGGLTPDPGLTNELIKNISSQCEVHIMIRPRAGDFNYSESEFEAMKHNLLIFAKLGVHGVVYGCLNEQGELDQEKVRVLTIMAKRLRMRTTFHRAIDVCLNPRDAVKDLIDIGVDRVLTSGGKPTALEGLGQIKRFLELAENQMEIMPGSGINASNVESLIKAGCKSVHFSCRKKIKEDALGFGDQYIFDQNRFVAIQSKLG